MTRLLLRPLRWRRRVPEEPDAELSALAGEVAGALRSFRLGARPRRELLSRALAGGAPSGSRPVGSVVRRLPALPRPGRRASALLGGTAVIAAAAIGVTLVRQRRLQTT